MEWGIGAKIWLGAGLVTDGIVCIVLFWFLPDWPMGAICNLIIEAGLITGRSLLLFAKKKVGFYLLCVCAVVIMIFNLINDENAVLELLKVVVKPTLTYLVIRSRWDELDWFII